MTDVRYDEPPAPADLIAGEDVPLKDGRVVSVNPARPSDVLWSAAPERANVDRAVAAARAAAPAWAAWPLERRAEAIRVFRRSCEAHAAELAQVLLRETGKASWESTGEAGALAAKIDITLDPQTDQNWGLRRIAGYELELSGSKTAATWFRPHGVMAVFGPFNFPLHLPNGHIIPALLAGNTVVFKPSDKTPACGQLYARLLHDAMTEAGAPAGVVNLVHGDAENSAALAAHRDIDGVLFTGSWPVARKIMEQNLDHPGRIVALELGGSNPAVVMGDADLKQAAIEVVRCAFNTTGQRCTCTRRLIVENSVADRFFAAIVEAANALKIGKPDADPPSFMGPIITAGARDGAMEFLNRLTGAGGESLLAMTAPEDADGGYYVTPGIVRVPRFTAEGPSAGGSGYDAGCDEEVFGPLLRCTTVSTLDEAIEQANATRYGLAASIFTHSSEAIDRFRHEARAGCVNINCGTAGASSKLPFGGLGHSGNQRPAGSFALDYCAYPVASMSETSDAASLAPGMTFEDGWI